MARRISESDRARIVGLIRDAIPYRQIAEQVGCSLYTISKVAREEDLSPADAARQVADAAAVRRARGASTRAEQADRIIDKIADIETLWAQEVEGDEASCQRLHTLARTIATLATAHRTLEDAERAARQGDGSSEARSMMAGLIEGIASLNAGTVPID